MIGLEKILVQENLSVPSYTSNLNSKLQTSYLSYTLKAIAEYKEGIREGTKNFYVALSEADGSIESITEAFSDFFQKVIELIKKFLKFIQKLFDKFVMRMHGLIKSDKYLRKHKDVFDRFSSDDEFTYSGYEYTFSYDVPKTEFYKDSETYGFKAGDKDVSKSITDYKDKFVYEIENDYEDRFRAWVIGKEGTIASEDFGEELFAVYRNDDTSSIELDVTSSLVRNAYYSFDKYEKVIKEVKKKKEDIEKEYKKKQKEVESFDKTFKAEDYEKFVKTYIDSTAKNITKAKLSTDDISNISLIMKAKADQVTRSMDIHAMAFAAKLDALKEQYIQNKTILYKVLYKLGIRESGLPVDIDDVNVSSFNDFIDLMESISNIELKEDGMEITTESGEWYFIEGDYDMLDLSGPSDRMIDAFVENGIITKEDGKEDLPDDVNYKINLKESYDDTMNYNMFIASEAMKDARLLASIYEVTMKSSANTYTIINENLADSIKNGARKIWNLIVTMWNKFSQNMEELFKSDVKYLEKYKDIILNREVKFEIDSWSYFDNNHGVSKAISPSYTINYNNSVTLESKEKVDEYYISQANTFLSKLGSKDKIDKLADFQDTILNHLRGPEATYDGKQLHANMKNMYDFCRNYKTGYKKSAKELLDFIDKKSQDLEREIDRAAGSIKVEENPAEADNTNESAIIQELEINKTDDGGSSSSSSTSASTSGSKPYSQPSKDDKENINKDIAKDKENVTTIKNDESKDGEQKKKELEIKQEFVMTFLNYSSSILGAKLTFGEEAYKDYMKIIRNHVRTYANNAEAKDSSNKVSTPTNTDTSKEDSGDKQVDRATPEETPPPAEEKSGLFRKKKK